MKSFQGDVINVLSKDIDKVESYGGDGGEWLGEVNGVIGVFPCYVAENI